MAGGQGDRKNEENSKNLKEDMILGVRLLHSRTAINLFAVILSFGVGLLIRFFATPYIVSRLGAEAYGFVGVSANILGIVALITVATNALANRFIAVEYQSGRIDEAKAYYSSLIVSNEVLAVILIAICAILCCILEKLINVPAAMVLDVKILFAILSANMVVSLMSSAWSVGAFIRNRLDVSNGIQIAGNIVQGVALILLFGLGLAHIWYVGAAIFAMGVVVAVGNFFAMHSLMPGFTVKWRLFSCAKVMVLAKAGLWNLISRISDILGQGVDLLIANIFLGATFAGVLAISKNVPFLALSFFAAVVSAFVPMMLKRYAQGSHSQFTVVFSRAVKVCCFLAAFPMAFLILFGESFYSLWLPSQDSGLLNTLTILGTLNLTLAMPLECVWSIFTIANKLQWPTLFMLCNSGLVFLTMLLGCCMLDNPLHKLFVVAGARAGWGVIRSLSFLPMYGAHVARLPKSMLYGMIAACVAMFAVNLCGGFIIKGLFSVKSWGGLFVATIMFAVWGSCFGFALIRWRLIWRALPIIRTKRRMIHFVHRKDKLNPGDMAACPVRYFCWPDRCKEHDIDNMDLRQVKENDIVIVGGGGLFDCREEWNRTINALLSKCNMVIAWSVGFNRHSDSRVATAIAYGKFKLLTVRDKDHPSGFEWLPCVSCMAIDDNFVMSEGTGCGVISHRDHVMQSDGDTVVSSEGFSSVVKFIARHAAIKTNSYHAAYWAGLLGKKVVLEHTDYSEKFKWLSETQLETAKRMNEDFHERVMKLIQR